jgi:Na+-transporting NADH:ubiquinone oxidoreductase subunit NqrF
MSDLGNTLVSILVAIVGVAIVSVIVSKNSSSAATVRAGGKALSTLISEAVNVGTPGYQLGI